MASAQTLEYEVIRSDEPIGSMTVSRKQTGTREVLRSDMSVEVSFGFTVRLRFTYEAQFEAGRLVKATVRNYRNDKLRDETLIEQQADGLHVLREGTETIIREPVSYSILQAYYEPPGTREQVFSERWGRYQPFGQHEDGRRVMEVANGDHSYYTYQNGLCQEIELDMTLATLFLRLKTP
jgi:hypothetical protein